MELIQKIDKLREQIAQIKEEIDWLVQAPLSREDLKARVSAWFDRMSSDAAEVNNKFLSLRNPGASITEVNPLGVTQGVNLPVGQSNASGMLNISIAPQLIWLFGDTIKKVFLAKVDAMDYVPGLPLIERTTRREQLTTQLRTLEEKEEELICEAELAHLPIYRRADADPAVVLAYDPDGDMGAQGARLVSISSSAPTSNPAAP